MTRVSLRSALSVTRGKQRSLGNGMRSALITTPSKFALRKSAIGRLVTLAPSWVTSTVAPAADMTVATSLWNSGCLLASARLPAHVPTLRTGQEAIWSRCAIM